MRAKHYPIEKVETLAKVIEAAPELPPKTLTAEEVLKRYSREIKELHSVKNYTPSDIAALMKKHGVYVAVKDVKTVLGLAPNMPRKRTEKR